MNYAHYGNTSPLVEGWTLTDNHASVLEGTVTGDLGLNAWFIDDNGTTGGSRRNYTSIPTPAEIVSGNVNGWALRAVGGSGA